MSAEGIWHSHKVAKEPVPEVTTGRDLKKGRELQALIKGLEPEQSARGMRSERG